MIKPVNIPSQMGEGLIRPHPLQRSDWLLREREAVFTFPSVVEPIIVAHLPISSLPYSLQKALVKFRGSRGERMKV